jgi:hypothetical protein
MPLVGFEPMIPVFERAKTVHASDGAATVLVYILTTHAMKGEAESQEA